MINVNLQKEQASEGIWVFLNSSRPPTTQPPSQPSKIDIEQALNAFFDTLDAKNDNRCTGSRTVC
ncbi:MAG: hypothetical protein F6K16_29530 [Symploca sp. SIO2B6]|nr:hypothetical protein [Symploca sp. SIO2B6]